MAIRLSGAIATAQCRTVNRRAAPDASHRREHGSAESMNGMDFSVFRLTGLQT
jgi:hypothetical protein